MEPSGREVQADAPVEEAAEGLFKLAEDPREEILQFCTQIAKWMIMLSEWENTMDGLLWTTAIMVECNDPVKMMDKIEELLQNRARTTSREEENKTLRRECERLRTEIQKTQKELEEAKDRMAASGRALQEVKESLALPVDVVNKVRLFEK